jgi:phenylalanyl-tRNA synthetase beta chain
MITPETKNILVEAAWFDPASVRRSSRRHLLHTDASHRFERGADFNAAPLANALVSELILASGGKPEGELVDIVDAEVEARTAKRPSIEISVAQVRRHLGTTIDAAGITSETVLQYLTSLGCEPLLHGLDLYLVKLPSWRLDLEREIDLVEEIARVYGYNRFANTLPTPLPVTDYPSAAAEQAVRRRLLELGFSEAVSSTFASHDDAALFYASEAGRHSVSMENPLSEEASLLRPSLAPGMLGMLAHNLNRDVREVRLFEQGQVFSGTVPADATFVSEVYEIPQLALGLTSASAQATALHAAVDAPVFELKGVIEALASLFTLPGGEAGLSFTTSNTPAWLEAGRSAVAMLNNQPLAVFGELAAVQREARKLRQLVYLAQLDLAKLYELPLKRVTAHNLSRFQAVERDFSFVFADSVAWQTIAEAISTLAIPEMTRLTPEEIFRDPKGKAIPAGQYSLLLRTVFQSHDRTLREEEIAGWTSRIVDALKGLGGTQRA